MKAVLPALLAAAASIAAWPVAADAPAAERTRIAAERRSVEAQYQGEERACWDRFAVNDCLAEARARRRSTLADLRRQEISLNDGERKQRAAERLRSIEQRSTPVAPTASPAKIRDRGDRGDRGDRAGRDATAAQRAAEQAAREAERARRTNAKPRADGAGRVSEELARRESERARRAERAAANVQRREALQQQARERQEALQRRLAERQKPPASSLPP